MSSIDFRLQHLQKTLPGEARLHVLLQYRNSLRRLAKLGFKVSSVAGDIAAGSILVRQLEQLAQDPDVNFIGGSRLLKDEMDVSSIYSHLRDPVTTLRTIPTLGAGAIIGVIDSGFDLTHPCFQNAKGKTRILTAWEQKNECGRPPAGFDYGVEFDQEAINQSLADNKVVIVKNSDRAGSHGTYVAGVAAGKSTPRGVFAGVAPEAELILVSYRNDNDVPIGGSAFVLDAIDFIRKRAHALNRPVVINISQGDNLGAHDGTSLLERAMDNVVKEGRVLIVNSAGNERGGMASHHARGQVDSGSRIVLPFALMLGADHSVDGDTIDLWYRGGDRFAVAMRTPDGWQSEPVEPDTSTLIRFPAGNRAHIYSETNYPTNGDNRISVILEKGEVWAAGTWGLILTGKEVRLGDFDAWADRSNGVTVIGFQAYQSDAATVTLPGNARRVITVGGFVSRPEQETNIPGTLASGSSIGPTRDGRVKPDLTAPSTLVVVPGMRVDSSPPPYVLMSGTSMAAPQVSGVIALLWSLWPRLKADCIRAALCSTARKDVFTGVTPSTSWGAGKIDADEAYKALSSLIEKGESVMENQVVFEFEMDPQEMSDGKLAGMHIRIEVRNGQDLAISGTSGADDYEGLLVFKKRDVTSKESEFAELLRPSHTEGGDQCYINGVWYDPCPVQPPKP